MTAVERPKPLLVIVSGVPASGKTTLGRRLAPELGLVRLCKDELRELMGDWLPPNSYDASKALGGAAYTLCFHLAAEMLSRGVGVLLEAAFSRGSAEASLLPLVAESQAVLIHLTAPLTLTDQRFRQRHTRGERHPSHMDELAVAYDGLLFEPAWPRWEHPLDLDVPTLVIDTTDHYVEDPAEIVNFVRAAQAHVT